MDMDIPERLKRVERIEIDGKVWIRAQEYLSAIRAPQSSRITGKIAPSEKKRICIRHGRAWYEKVRVLYISPAAALQLAIDHARCPSAWIREWIAAA